jgi:hypothetical protein
MQKPERSVFAIHTTGYYNAIWSTMYNSINRDPALRENSKMQTSIKEVIPNTRRHKNIWLRGQKEFSMTREDEHDKDIEFTIDDSNSLRLDRHPEYPTSETMAKRGPPNQSQASKVGSIITPTSHERRPFFDPNTETGNPNESRHEASSSTADSKKKTRQERERIHKG